MPPLSRNTYGTLRYLLVPTVWYRGIVPVLLQKKWGVIRNNAIRVSGAEGYQEELTLYVGVPRVYLHTTASYMVHA